jgi:hypothetical protein
MFYYSPNGRMSFVAFSLYSVYFSNGLDTCPKCRWAKIIKSPQSQIFRIQYLEAMAHQQILGVTAAESYNGFIAKRSVERYK